MIRVGGSFFKYVHHTTSIMGTRPADFNSPILQIFFHIQCSSSQNDFFLLNNVISKEEKNYISIVKKELFF